MSILGLTSGKTFADQSFYSLNDRRQVFHSYPNGAPLTGLLSLMEDEPTDNPEFGWFEKRYVDIKTNVAAGDEPLSATGTGTALTSPADLVAGTVYRLYVDSTDNFKVDHQIWIKDVPVTGGTSDIHGTIVEIVNGTTLEFRASASVSDVINANNPTTSLVGNDVFCLGTAKSEGARSGTGRLVAPINPSNYTQIFRDPIYFTATSLKIPAVFDKTGLYKTKSKDACLDHMTGIEKAFMFGNKSIQNVAHPITGELVPMRTTGGLLYFLKEYEKANGGTVGYRPGGNALTSNADDDKRIINVANGTLPKAEWDTYLERVFRRTNNKAFEKIVFCGNGVLQAINSLIENNIVTHNKNLSSNESTYGMQITSVETVFGTLHFKAHPLFTNDPTLRYSALIVDVGELKYRALNDRDTTLLPNRQANDEDGRKDEWLTEAGLEVRFPESHMMINNLKAISV